MNNFFHRLKDQFIPFLKWLPELKDTKILKADIIA